MREKDRNIRELANPAAQRYHRGPLGQVLERYLSSHRARRHSDYSLVELEQLWLEAASLEPAIGLQLFDLFTPQDWHVIAHLAQFCADVRQAVLCWVRYAPLARTPIPSGCSKRATASPSNWSSMPPNR